MEHSLICPQQIHGGQDHARSSSHCPPAIRLKCAQQDQKLPDKAVQPRQPDGRQHHHHEHARHQRHASLQTAQLGDLAGVATLVDEPHQKEQRASGKPVVHHLQDASLQALDVEGERAQDDETQMSHRGVSHEPFQVSLHGSHDRPVEDADHAEREKQRSEIAGGFGEEIQPETQKPVSAELQQNPRQDDRSSCGGFRVGIGQPSVKRKQRHFHGERQSERQKHPAGCGGGERLRSGDLNEVEGNRAAGGRGMQEDEAHDADQHDRRTQHRVEEEFDSGITSVFVPPLADEEIHRHQHHLKEHEEQKQVQSQECA